MVLTLKRWKSRSSPGIEGGETGKPIHDVRWPQASAAAPRLWLSRNKRGGQSALRSLTAPARTASTRLSRFGAGWSSPVARQAHNLKVTGSNPVPATNDIKQPLSPLREGLFSFMANAIRATTSASGRPPRCGRCRHRARGFRRHGAAASREAALPVGGRGDKHARAPNDPRPFSPRSKCCSAAPQRSFAPGPERRNADRGGGSACARRHGTGRLGQSRHRHEAVRAGRRVVDLNVTWPRASLA